MEEQGRSFDEESILNMFRKDISNIPLLEREDELALARKAKTGDEEALNRLVESNLRWVLKIVFDMWRPGLPLLDMISEGCIALYFAAKLFDPELGYRLMTFSKRNIQWRVTSLIISHKKHCLESLDEVVYEDDAEITRKDLLISDEIEADEICFCSDIESLLDRLSDREKHILKLRYWEDKSLDEIGNLLALSKSRVGMIEAGALRKIRFSTYNEPAVSEAYALS